MPKIVVFHYTESARVPRLDAAACKAIREKFDAVIRDYPGVRFEGVYVGDDGRGICEWKAPDLATVNEIIVKVEGRPPIDGMVLVRRIL